VKPILHISFVFGPRCHSCGKADAYVAEKQLLCCACLGIELQRQERALEASPNPGVNLPARRPQILELGMLVSEARRCGLLRGAA
jgi:hypothetical protein